MNLKIQICSDIDYNRLVAEIYCDDQFVALLSQENGPEKLMVEFPKPDATNAVRAVDLQWFLDAIQAAKNKLLAGIH